MNSLATTCALLNVIEIELVREGKAFVFGQLLNFGRRKNEMI